MAAPLSVLASLKLGLETAKRNLSDKAQAHNAAPGNVLLKAEYNVAEAEVTVAKCKVKVAEHEAKDDSDPDKADELEKAEAKLEKAEAKLEEAETKLKEAKSDLKEAERTDGAQEDSPPGKKPRHMVPLVSGSGYHGTSMAAPDPLLLPRTSMVKGIVVALESHPSGVFFVRGPPATGKTTLAQLAFDELRAKHGAWSFRWIPCTSATNPFDALVQAAVLDASHNSVSEEPTVVVFDDAQHIYKSTCHDFWLWALKGGRTHNIKLVFTVLYNFDTDSSPISTKDFPGILPHQMFASLEEAGSVIEMWCALMTKMYATEENPSVAMVAALEHPLLHAAILSAASNPLGAHLGLVRILLDSIEKGYGRKEYPELPRDILELITAPEAASYLRCFSSRDMAHLRREAKNVSGPLADILSAVDGYVLSAGDLDNEFVKQALRIGFFLEVDRRLFCHSGIAQVLLCRSLFDRAPVAASISDLIKGSFSAFRQKDLKDDVGASARRKELGLGKEGGIQRMFHAALKRLVSPVNMIVSEFSTKNAVMRRGAIDFYVNSNLKYGIELVVLGDRLDAHMARFAAPDGAYCDVGFKDWRVVDVQVWKGERNKEGERPNLVTVYCDPTFSSIVSIVDGTDEIASMIELQP